MIIFNNNLLFGSQKPIPGYGNPTVRPQTRTFYTTTYTLIQNTIPALFDNNRAPLSPKWASTKQPYQVYPSVKPPHRDTHAAKVFSLGIHQLKGLMLSDWETNSKDLYITRVVWFKVLTNFWKQKRLPTNQFTVRKNTPFYEYYMRENESIAKFQHWELLPAIKKAHPSYLQKLFLNFSTPLPKPIVEKRLTNRASDALYARFFFKLKKQQLQVTAPFKYRSLLGWNPENSDTFARRATQPAFNLDQASAAGTIHNSSEVQNLNLITQSDHRLRWLNAGVFASTPKPVLQRITQKTTLPIKSVLGRGPNNKLNNVLAENASNAFKKFFQNPLLSGRVGSNIEMGGFREPSNRNQTHRRRAQGGRTKTDQPRNYTRGEAEGFLTSGVVDYLIWSNQLSNSLLNPLKSTNPTLDARFLPETLRKSNALAKISRYITIPRYEVICPCTSMILNKKNQALSPSLLKNLTTEQDRCWSYLVGEFIALEKPTYFKTVPAVDPSTLQPFFCNYCGENSCSGPRQQKTRPNIQRVGHTEVPKFLCLKCNHCTHEQRGLHLYNQLRTPEILLHQTPTNRTERGTTVGRGASTNKRSQWWSSIYAELTVGNLPTSQIEGSRLMEHRRHLSSIVNTYFTNVKFLKSKNLPNLSTPISVWFSLAGRYFGPLHRGRVGFCDTGKTTATELKGLILLSSWVRDAEALFELPTSPYRQVVQKNLRNYTTPNILDVVNSLEGEEIPLGESASSDVSDDRWYGSGILYTMYPQAHSTAYKDLTTTPLENSNAKTAAHKDGEKPVRIVGSSMLTVRDLSQLKARYWQPHQFIWAEHKNQLTVLKARYCRDQISLKMSPAPHSSKKTTIPWRLPNATHAAGLIAETWVAQIYSSITIMQGSSEYAKATQPEQLKWAKRVLVNSTKLSQTNYKFSYKVNEKVGYGISTIYDRVQGAIKELPEIMRRNVHVSSLASAIYRLLVFKEVDEWTNHVKSWYQKHGYKTHKRIFYTFRRLLNSIYLVALYSMRVVGLYFQLKGKVNSKGGMRKRVFRAFHGRFGSSTLLTIFQYKFKQIWCKTGAIGLKTVMVHRTRQYIPKYPITNRISGHKLVYTN